MKKDIIYIDIEDDITAIIDKIKAAKSKIVALVPPKRSTALQSAVNMKLLVRAASDVRKRLVLVTNETPLLNLAGGIGLMVARDLHSKPYIPEVPEQFEDIDSIIDGGEIDLKTPVGELAGDKDLSEETDKPLPDKDEAVRDVETTEAISKKSTKSKKIKAPKLKIPNFERFRSKLFLILFAVVLLFGGWYWAFRIAPKAVINIEAQTSRIDTVVEFTADTAQKDNDFEKFLLKAEKVEIKRTVTEPLIPTGEKNVGNKASGTITVTNFCFNPGTLSAGTLFTSNSGKTFVSTADVAVPDATPSAGSCEGQETTAQVSVEATVAGGEYNLAPTGYTVDSYDTTELSGFGSQMTGGTDKIVKTVVQKDIDDAKDKLLNKDNGGVVDELRAKFGEDIVPIDESFVATNGKISSKPALGEEVTSDAEASMVVTYTMLGLKRDTLSKVLDDYQLSRLQGSNQQVYDNGLDNLIFSLVKKKSVNNMEFRLRTSGYIGPQIDIEQLAQDISGKRYSAVVSAIKSIPGVRDVQVEFSPFWVFSAPNADKIDISLNITETNL